MSCWVSFAHEELTLSLWLYGWHGIQTDRDGNPNVFNLNRDEDELKLNANNAKSENRWNPNNQFVFRLRKYFLSALTRRGFSFLDFLCLTSTRRAFSRHHSVSARHPRIA